MFRAVHVASVPIISPLSFSSVTEEECESGLPLEVLAVSHCVLRQHDVLSSTDNTALLSHALTLLSLRTSRRIIQEGRTLARLPVSVAHRRVAEVLRMCLCIRLLLRDLGIIDR